MNRSRGHRITRALKRGELDPNDPEVKRYMENVADTVTASGVGINGDLRRCNYRIPVGSEKAVIRTGLIQRMRERS